VERLVEVADIAFWQRPLPRPNRRLSTHAARVAACAERLIQRWGGQTYITITAEVDGPLRLGWWNSHMEPIAELNATIDDFCLPETGEGALQRAGAELLAYLVGRWPPGASPPALGILTDGVGVAFSPRYPSPRTTGWAVLHCGGGAQPLSILPFATATRGPQAGAQPTVH